MLRTHLGVQFVTFQQTESRDLLRDCETSPNLRQPPFQALVHTVHSVPTVYTGAGDGH